MIIPISELDSDTLCAILQEYITREGTDYGLEELTLTDKIDALMQQVTSGSVVIVYDEASESVNLMGLDEYKVNYQER